MKAMEILKKIQLKTHTTLIVLVIGLLGVVLGGILIFSALNKEEGHKVTTISEASLQDIIEISELSTVDYTYNAIAKAVDEDEEVKYYVAYEGIVTAGINFEKIDIEVDEENKKITFIVPDVEVQDIEVNMGTMEYIFEDDDYETETVSQEAYKISLADLENRVKEENMLFDLAKENAIESVKALFTPWIEQIDETYIVQVR